MTTWLRLSGCNVLSRGLGWSLRQLARASRVPRDSVARFERGGGVRPATLKAIQDTLEKAGVVFIRAANAASAQRDFTSLGER
jgi:transcriptional regulator with XRE-family HTH domain